MFIDPTDCSIPFETVAALALHLKKVDFIINIATGTDANRNLGTAMSDSESPVRKKYARFLGGDDFFMDTELQQLAKQKQFKELRFRFRNAYQDRLRQIGYEHFAIEPIRHYYDLLFASRHPTGLAFWKKAQKYSPDNQASFNFD